MKIRVSATRMELMKLKRRLALAVRGHRLLKDKQDELVRQFFLHQEKYRIHLKKYKDTSVKAHRSFEFLKGTTSLPGIDLACRSGTPAVPVKTGKSRVLNLSVPLFEWTDNKPEPLYGLLDGAGLIENVIEDYLELVPQLIRMAELEKTMMIILEEIEVTKRRVNALEYKLIPSLQDTISAISSKLSELELSTITRLMRVKEILDKESADLHKGSPG